MKDIDNEQLKRIEINLLKVFIQCCETLSLKYYVMGGTMLGAIRHNGFIPWDDDIDVGMMRSDYEVFLEKAPSLMPSYCFLQSISTEKEYLNIYAKLRDSRTTFIETKVKDRNINHGVYIDIFPLDYYPTRKLNQLYIDSCHKLLYLRIWSNSGRQNSFKHSVVDSLKIRILKYILAAKYETTRDAVLAKDKLCRSVNKSRLIANYGGAWGKKEIVPAEWYGDGVKGCFEGITVTLPAEYEKWLTQVYGNYMELPPVEKRVSHHNTDIIDLDRSYLDYLNIKRTH